MDTNRFDRAAADWDKKDQRRALAAAIAAGIARLPLHPAMEALEYGCGTGLVGLALAPQLKSLTAADSSPGMLATLSDKIAAAGLTNVYPLRLDLHDENCPRQFDLIFSAMTLHHLADVGSIIEKLVAGLKPGGYIALADLDSEDGSFHGDNTESVMHHGFDRDGLADTLRRLGCGVIQARTVHIVVKPNAAGVEQPYPVFLLTATKERP
jgi:2-polyprenyl-3-methyl-5-hydroxy-6-metoxy-1,4-benzoquinol methylase